MESVVKVIEESAAVLPDYAGIPIAFRVASRFRVEPIQGGLGGLTLVEEPVIPYLKDYDAIPGEGPLHWQEHWDLAIWGILGAFAGTERIGGAAIAWKTEGVWPLELDDDTAVLWDLRVHPDYRGHGVGQLLFAQALKWARERQCHRLVVETQNINVAACRFYSREGCTLRAINCHAYSGDAQDEVQLLWYKDL